METKKKFIIIYILIFLNSCSILQSTDESTVYTKSKEINRDFVLKNWIKKNNQFCADLVYENINSKSLIIINSNCRKNLASSLSILKESILSGIEKIEVQKEIKSQTHNRDSLLTDFTGNLDGVNRAMTLAVFQRDFCIYDLILISKNISTRENERADFNILLEKIFNFGN